MTANKTVNPAKPEQEANKKETRTQSVKKATPTTKQDKSKEITEKKTPVKKAAVKKTTVKKAVVKVAAKAVREKGRPSKYEPEFAEKAFKLCLLGAKNEELADFFEVSVQTILEWREKHSDFLDAIKKGKETADAQVAHSLFKRATGYTYHEEKAVVVNGMVETVPIERHCPPDTAAAFIWLKNRQPKYWRDKVNVTADITLAAIPQQDVLEEIYQRALEKAKEQQATIEGRFKRITKEES